MTTTPLRRAACLLLAAAGLLPACAQRRLEITSEPSGATVWVNDVEVGRTPLTSSFVHYGTYDVRLRKDGFEPLATSAKAEAPWYEYMGPDLVAEALPNGVVTTVRWSFKLSPSLESTQDREAFEADLLEKSGRDAIPGR